MHRVARVARRLRIEGLVGGQRWADGRGQGSADSDSGHPGPATEQGAFRGAVNGTRPATKRIGLGGASASRTASRKNPPRGGREGSAGSQGETRRELRRMPCPHCHQMKCRLCPHCHEDCGLCRHCHERRIPAGNKKYCEVCSPLASTLWKRNLRRECREQGAAYWRDWASPERRREYQRNYMKKWRERRRARQHTPPHPKAGTVPASSGAQRQKGRRASRKEQTPWSF